MNPQAFTAAMQALTASVTGLNAAIVAQNASAKPSFATSSPASGGRSTSSQAFDAVAGKFSAILGPLALLGEVLKAPIAGFQVLAKSAALVSQALAPIFLPATILLSTAMVALSEVLTSVLEPGFESFANIVLSLGIPAIITFVDLIIEATDTLELWARQLGVNTNKPPAELALDGVEGFINAFAPMIGTLGRKASEELVSSGALDDLKPKEGGRGADIVMRALRDVMGSLRNGLGTKPSIQGLDGVARGVQLAAFGDPLEKRALEAQLRFFGKVERIVDRIFNERASRSYGPGEGDFSEGGAGSGGEGDF